MSRYTLFNTFTQIICCRNKTKSISLSVIDILRPCTPATSLCNSLIGHMCPSELFQVHVFNSRDALEAVRQSPPLPASIWVALPDVRIPPSSRGTTNLSSSTSQESIKSFIQVFVCCSCECGWFWSRNLNYVTALVATEFQWRSAGNLINICIFCTVKSISCHIDRLLELLLWLFTRIHTR